MKKQEDRLRSNSNLGKKICFRRGADLAQELKLDQFGLTRNLFDGSPGYKKERTLSSTRE